jgi:hypothetical protein
VLPMDFASVVAIAFGTAPAALGPATALGLGWSWVAIDSSLGL